MVRASQNAEGKNKHSVLPSESCIYFLIFCLLSDFKIFCLLFDFKAFDVLTMSRVDDRERGTLLPEKLDLEVSPYAFGN